MQDQEFCAEETYMIQLNSLEEDFPANEGADLGDEWRLEDESYWDPSEDEPSFEVSAAYLERQAIEEAIRNQKTPCKARLMKEVDSLMTAQGAQAKGPSSHTAGKQ